MRARGAVAVLVVAGCAGGKAALPDGAAGASDGDVVDAAGGPDAQGAIDGPAPPPPDAPPGTPDARPPDAAPPPVCGDGVVAGGEQCDDGNSIPTDGCVACAWARCGDGVIRAGVEECDDGNTVDGDACSAICLACAGGSARLTWPTNHHCYTRFDGATDWGSARAACEAAKGELVTFSDAAENAAITAALVLPGTNYWMGFFDQATEGVFLWANDEPVVFTAWAAGEPNDSGGVEDCVELYPTGAWNDLECAQARPYLCEDEGWRVRPTDNHAYRYVYQRVDWNSALSQCAAMGGHLATIGSMGENDFVLAAVYTNMWIGGTDAALEGAFTWTTGEAFVFSAFGAGEPNDFMGAEDCLEIRAGASGWNDENCASARGYICEID